MEIYKFQKHDVNFINKVVLIRVDFNVPLEKSEDSYYITDHTRINESIPTIKQVIDKNPRLIILISHLGRPKGKHDNSLSLFPIKNYLSLKLNKKISFLTQYYPLTDLSKFSGIVMLENIRFLNEEEHFLINNNLSQYLSKYTDIYINDAFGCSHRNHTSIVGVNSENRLAGKLLMKEISNLSPILSRKIKKTLIIGGGKIQDKVQLIENLIPTLDNIIIGGAMAFSFLKNINNLNIGKTLYDENSVEYTKKIYNLVQKYKVSNKLNLVLPIDWVVSESINSQKIFTTNQDIPENYMGLDIGPESICLFNKTINSISKDSIIIWNGPMGVFEKQQFSYGTESIAKTLVDMKDNKIVIGGGDSVSALNKFITPEEITIFLNRGNHISTGGGACLEFLEGKSLPGINYLNNVL